MGRRLSVKRPCRALAGLLRRAQSTIENTRAWCLIQSRANQRRVGPRLRIISTTSQILAEYVRRSTQKACLKKGPCGVIVANVRNIILQPKSSSSCSFSFEMAGPHNNAAIFEDHIPKNRPPLKRASTTFVDRVISDWWWWELGSLFLSVACVGAIVSVVSLHNGQPQPEFVLQGITLNAFVSVLAAVSKAALILPISEAIGQLKWYWFQDGAPLWDFQVYDAASRGPWGSFLLLFKSRCRFVVVTNICREFD